MKKLWMALLICLTLIGCKDEVTSSQPTVIHDGPGNTIPTEPDPQCPGNPIQWTGLERVDEIKQTSVRLSWTPKIGAAAYHIFRLDDQNSLESKFVASANGLKASHTVTGLKANKVYLFYVRVMMDNGLIDSNKKLVQARTLAWPGFANESSIYFNGRNSLATPSSDEVLTSDKKWTISLWFKTSISQHGKRLITYHKGTDTDSSAAYLGLDKGKITLGYRNKKGHSKKLSADFYYFDNDWHHVAGVYKKKKGYELYIDGKRRAAIKDDFVGFGSQLGHIGSFNNVRMNVEAYIDEVSAWASNLSANEITEIYNGGSAFNLNQHSRDDCKRSWWRLGDDARDNERMIHDQFNDLHALGVGLDPGDFSPDSP